MSARQDLNLHGPSGPIDPKSIAAAISPLAENPRHFNLRKHLGRGHVSGLIVLLTSRLSSGNA